MVFNLNFVVDYLAGCPLRGWYEVQGLPPMP